MTISEPFITAEESISPKFGIWVMLTAFSIKVSGQVMVDRFEITTSTGYRAVLPACICDRAVCLKGCSSRDHCHYGMHIERARVKASAVAESYGSAYRGLSDPSAGRTTLRFLNGRVRDVSVREWSQGEWAQVMEKPVDI